MDRAITTLRGPKTCPPVAADPTEATRVSVETDMEFLDRVLAADSAEEARLMLFENSRQ